MANQPQTIPHPWDKDELLSEAYRRGWNHGHGVACHNVPSLGDPVSRCVDWQGIGNTVTAENIRDYHQMLTFAGADGSREYSPFEFTAHWINTGGGDDTLSDDNRATYADDMWEAFDAGQNDAITFDLSSYTDEDYGIETELEA